MATAYKAMNDTVDPWAIPDLSILEEGRRPPPPLPPAMFGKAWGELERLAADKGAPVDYVALSWLTVCSSLIGAKRRVVPYRSTWREPPIIWLGLVGDPSHNKSPALDPFQSILRKLEDDRLEEHEEALNVWRADCERARAEKAAWQEEVKAATKEGLNTPPLPPLAQEPAEPRRRRYSVGDVTPESMGAILVGNPQGCLMIRDELAGWVTSFDRYNPGGRAYWLEAFGGRPYTVDRKGSPEPLRVPYNGVSIIGSIQPAKLGDCLLSASDDGLAARLLFVWPERPPFSRPTATADVNAFEEAARRIDCIEWGRDEEGKRTDVGVPLSPEAMDVFDDCQRFYRDQEADAAGLLKSFIGKLSGLTLRLAIASEYARWAYEGGSEPEVISLATMEAVGDFVSAYAIPMAARVYGDACLPPVERNAATLARYIRRNKLRSINARSVMRDARLPGLRDAGDVDPAIEALVEAQWLRADPKRAGCSVGRLSRDYLVNPAIYGGR